MTNDAFFNIFSTVERFNMKTPISPELLQPTVWQQFLQQKNNVSVLGTVQYYYVRANDGLFVHSDKTTVQSLEGKLTNIETSTSTYNVTPTWVITITDSNNTIHKIEVGQRSFPALTFINALLGMTDRSESITSNYYYFIRPITIKKPEANNRKFAEFGISTNGTKQISGRMTNEEILKMFDFHNASPRLNFLHDAVQTIIKHL